MGVFRSIPSWLPLALPGSVVALITITALTQCVDGAHAAEPMPPERERTAAWYARNDAARERVVAVCRNDPGHTRQSPDCINASQGQILAFERDARRKVDMTPPEDPRFWAAQPEMRAQVLLLCSRMTPAQQISYRCDQARR